MGNLEHLKSEGFFRALIENSNEMLTLINEKNEIIYESAAIKSILGFDPEEKVGQLCFTNTCPEVLDETKSVFKKAIENPDIPISLFSKQYKKNGECVFTEGTVTNMLNNPNVKAIVCNYRDVTHRINAENTIRENEEKYRTFFEQAFDGVFISDKDYNITEVNENGAKMLGYSVKELKKIKFTDLISEEEKKNNPIKIKELLEGKSIINQRKITRKDGSEIVVLINAKMYPDGRFQSLITDITKSKANESKLIMIEEKFSALVNTVHGIVWEASINPFRSTFISKQAEEILGHSINRWLEEQDFWENHIHPDDREWVLNSYLKYNKDKQTNEFEYRMIAADGRIVWFKDIVTVVFENNEPKYLRGIMVDITKRKNAEEELAKTQENFSTLVNTVKGIVWEADAESIQFSFVSKQAEEILGYPVDEWINDVNFWSKHLHPDDKDWAFKYCVNCIKQKLNHEFEYRMIASDGRIVWLQDIVSVIVENDKPKYLRGIMVDITERKKAQEELKIKESYFKNLIEHSSSAIILISREGKFIYQSPVVEKIVGYAIEEESHTNVFQFIHPDERESFAKTFENLLNEPGGRVTGEFRFLHQDGHYVWLEGSVTNLLHDKSVNALIANYQDVTERKNTRARLENSEANLHTIFDNADTGYILMDTALNMISFNMPAQKFSKEDLNRTLIEGTNAIDYFPEDRKAFMKKKMLDALAGKTLSHEIKYPQSDGSNRWYFMRFYPVHNIEKKVFGVVLALTDVTERKMSELQRQKITHDLLQRNKAQEQFTYIVSHNLRSPVANIMGVTKLLQENDLTQEDKDLMMEGLVASAKKLDEVITDLNHILQVKRDVRENKEMVKFTDIVKDVELTIGEWIKKEEVKIITDFSEVDELLTLKSYLNSIFYNLISNSVKYRRLGIPSIIEIKSSIKNGNIKLSFKDNGMGIDLVKKGDQVFGLYKRFHTFVEGRGMGLYMVKTQVETLGGKIGLTSKVNEGTEFIIEFEE